MVPTTLREEPIMIGTAVVRHAKAVRFPLADVAVPRALVGTVPRQIARLRAAPSPG